MQQPLNSKTITNIVQKHLKPSLFQLNQLENKTNDLLLSGLAFPPDTQNRLILARQIGRIWLDVFQLYEWYKPEARMPRMVSLIKEGAAMILQNNWKTSNFDSKQSKFKTLKEYKSVYPKSEVIYACINDFKERDYINKDGVRILTGNAFLKYMLNNDASFVIKILQDEIKEFILKNNLATQNSVF